MDCQKKCAEAVENALLIAFTTLYEADIVVGSKLSGLNKRLHFIQIGQEWTDRVGNLSSAPSPADHVFSFFYEYARLAVSNPAAAKKGAGASNVTKSASSAACASAEEATSKELAKAVKASKSTPAPKGGGAKAKKA